MLLRTRAGQSGPGNWEKLREYERPTLILLRSPVHRESPGGPVGQSGPAENVVAVVELSKGEVGVDQRILSV